MRLVGKVFNDDTTKDKMEIDVAVGVRRAELISRRFSTENCR